MMKNIVRILLFLIVLIKPISVYIDWVEPNKKCLTTKVVYPKPYDIATCMQSCHYNCADCGKFKIVCDKYEE